MSITLYPPFQLDAHNYLPIFNKRSDHVMIDDIVCLEGYGNYTFLYFKDGKRLLCSKTLKQFESYIAKDYFLRIHKSYIVNITYINEYTSDEEKGVELTTGLKVAVSRRKKKEVEIRLSTNTSTKVA